MVKILKGKDVSDSIIQECAARVSERITKDSLAPKLVVINVGSNASNGAYIKSISKKASEAGVLLSECNFDENISFEDLSAKINEYNNDDKVNGILLMRPLPKSLESYEKDLCECIRDDKDVDASTTNNLSASFLNLKSYNPCTPEAVIKILDYYNIPIEAKRVVVVGRSLVVGKPLACMLLNRNATVTVCHSHTKDIHKITKEADIVVIAVGVPKKFDAKYFSKGQIVIDAGINLDEENNKICGDVDYDSVSKKVAAITPVPGGVGSVTSSILISHTL